MKKQILLFLSLVLLVGYLSAKGRGEAKSNAISVILDTDMGNDIDDALALDMIYKYVDMGKFNLLGIMNNKDSKHSTEFIDIMNTWYGYPNVPVGKIENGVVIDDYVNYAAEVCKLEKDGKPMFERTLTDYASLPDAHILYRQLLAEQPNHSVTVISIGFSTNLARLLDTPADQYSDMTGRELVAAKVKLLSVMAGSFTQNPRKEFNVVHDISAAQKVFAEWDTEIVVSPFELGAKVQYPATSIENDFDWAVNHPLVAGYNNYRPMPYDRATWDLTSVLYVAENENSFMNLSPTGAISVTDEGITEFREQTAGRHSYLTIEGDEVNKMKQYFIELIKTKPTKYSKY